MSENNIVNEKKELSRSHRREAAFMLIFEKMFSKDTCDEIIETAKEADEYEFDEFSQDIFRNVTDKEEELDAVIGEFSKTRSVSRIGKVSLAVLRIAVYESIYTDVPVNVAVSEAVSLSQKYSLENDVKFVNGLLGSFAKSEHIPEDKRAQVTIRQ